MVRAVNPRRTYDSSRRQDQARATRRTVLEAAHRRFVDDGYAATTIPAVAADAGVSVETIYKAFANKAGLAKAVFDDAVAGDDEPIPVVEREWVARITAEPDARRKLELFGEHIVDANVRTHAVQLMIRDAAASDAGAADVWAQLINEKVRGMGLFAKHLHDGGHVRAGVSANEARDVLALYLGPEVYDHFVNQQGWSQRRFGRWVGQQLIAALL